ncbi:MAG: hypothetical protein KAT28_00670 [Candidatus Aenigmarchaeota archaeon]|nr:hypothetical protein [Candidatus Aenigmarchaeota archaeon]
MKGTIEAGYIMKAALCGFLIAFNTVLFMNYFLDINIVGSSFMWFGLIDAALILLVAYPFKEGGTIAITIIFLVFGYALYGPYAEELAGPMKGIKESMSGMPELAEKQMHCMMLIFTNPMAYSQECGPDQEKVVEEQPEDFGLEIREFEIQPDVEIYAKMPIQIWTVLENRGDYPAVNVLINSTGEKYRNCELESLNISRTSGGFIDSLRPYQTHHYSMMGKVSDPWKGEGECTYAQNKMRLDGTIKTTYSYDYWTESYLELEAVKNVDEIKRFEVVSAREKAAPANVLMYTFIPLIWEGAGDGYREAIIPISFQNERKKDKISLRGETVHYIAYMADEDETSSWCKKVCSELNELECMVDCLASYVKEESKSHHCEAVYEDSMTGEILKGVSTDICGSYKGVPKYNSKGEYTICTMREELEASDEEDCNDKNGDIIKQDNNYWFCANANDKKIDIEFSEELNCKLAKGVIIHKVEGNYKRAISDKISLSIIGDQAKDYIHLSCDESVELSEDDIVKCESGENGEINLIWLNNKLTLKNREKKFVYSGVKITLTGFPDDATKFNFGVKSDATYRVTITRTNTFKVNNPYYTSSPIN